MRRHVELRAGVAVDEQDLAVVGLSGPIRWSGLIWNRGKVGQVHGYSGATSSERSRNFGAGSSPAATWAVRPSAGPRRVRATPDVSEGRPPGRALRHGARPFRFDEVRDRAGPARPRPEAHGRFARNRQCPPVGGPDATARTNDRSRPARSTGSDGRRRIQRVDPLARREANGSAQAIADLGRGVDAKRPVNRRGEIRWSERPGQGSNT